MAQAAFSPLISAAMRRCLRGYRLRDFKADLLAGLVVGIIAVPLSMALAIGTGVPPEHGLYTAIVAGGCAALFGGADLQVSGPTAAFVVVLVPVVQKFGLGGLCMASAMAGAMLMLAAVLRLGHFIKRVPHAVTLGFTGGIGVTIAVLQLRDFLGLQTGPLPESFLEKVYTLLASLPTATPADAAVGVVTLGLLLAWPRLGTRVPPALAALALATGLSTALREGSLGHAVRIVDRFGYSLHGVHHAGIPRSLPTPSLHWFSVGTGDMAATALAWAVLPSALVIAALAALESLLAAVVADGMSKRQHDSDSELFGIGVGNLLAPLFGGFAATGAIARTAANIRSGARSPISSLVHVGFVLAAILVLAPVLSQLPMAAMSALLLTVAWNMADFPGIVASLRKMARKEASVLAVTLVLTVAFDMVVGVVAGVALHAAFWLQKRLSESTAPGPRDQAVGPSARHTGRVSTAEPHGGDIDDSQKVVVHKVQGPLFFAAEEPAFAALEQLPASVRHVVLDLSDVPMLDEAGLHAVQRALQALEAQQIDVVMVAPEQPSARDMLEGAGLLASNGHLAQASSRAEALLVAGGSATRGN